MSATACRRTLGTLLGLVALLAAGPAWSQVVINEILYHPSNAAVQVGEDAEGLQFIELYNAGAGAVDLSGATLDGVTFTFPDGTELAAGDYLVITQDAALLALRGPAIPPGTAVFEWVAGVLANGGEAVRLVDAGAVVLDEVVYDDAGLWPAGADGAGASLELTNPAYDNTVPLAWRASAALSGTPGAPNGAFTEAPIVIQETPNRGAIVGDLDEVSITFSSPVSLVVAGDLVVDGSPAANVDCPTCAAGVGAGPWIFTGFDAPVSNPTVVAFGPGAIQDEQGDAFDGEVWIYPLSVPAIVINEVHYNPASATDAEEFIELFNADAEAVDVSGWQLNEFGAPGCSFPPGTVMEPGGYLVCARDPASLEVVSGFAADHAWGLGDRLSNGGEPIALVDDNGTTVDRIVYDDGPPWPAGPDGPDGNGPTMELVNPGIDNAQGRAWRASAGDNGTPGAVNSVHEAAPAIASEAPLRGSLVVDLVEISVTFSEPVVGVAAVDLTVGEPGGVGIPAAAVVGDGAGPYVFTVDPGAAAIVEVNLAAGSIETAGGTPFEGDQWLYFTRLPQIVINELHYNPDNSAVAPGENAEDLAFLELYNGEAEAVDLSGFAMTAGVEHIFAPGTEIAAGGYLVLAADPVFLQATIAIPPASPVVAWTAGGLANGGEKVEISDAYGHVIDEVRYEDAGDWTDEADGRGPSLELINPALDNDGGGAWQASVGAHGTPGAINSVHVVDPPPVIFAPRHLPPIPRANEDVTITATVIDDGEGAPQVTLHYRHDQNPPIAYTPVEMFDDGLHGDGAAGDGRFGAVVPGLGDEQQLDFYIEAGDGGSTSVAPAGHATPDQYGQPSQTYLAKFSNEILPVDPPVYHILVTAHNKFRQEALVGYPTRKQPFDATFIDGAGKVFYNVVERYRGQSSLSRFPSGYRVDFPRNNKLDSSLGFPIETLQLNAIRPMSQWITFELFNRAGLPAPRAGWAHLRYPGINYDNCCNGQNGYWGLHVVAERLDNDFLDSQGGAVPLRNTSSEGNLYRGRNDATLRWEGPIPATYFVNANGQQGYEKYNNEAEDFWQDLIALCDAVSNTPDEHYVEHVNAHVDVDNWAQYYALHALLGNREGGIYRDTGDDYFLYFPPVGDPLEPVHPDYGTDQLPDDRISGRSQMVLWDADSAMVGGDETIWRTQVPAPRRFLRHNAYAPIFVKAIEDFASNVYSIETMNDVIDGMPDEAFSAVGGNIDNPATKEQFKAWHARRLAFIHAETRDELTLVGGPDIIHAGGNSTYQLSGELQQAGTHNVTVNGQPATFSVFSGNWSFDLPLAIGPNPAFIEAWDRDGNVKQSIDASVFWNPVGPHEIHLELRSPKRALNDKALTFDVAIHDPIGRVHYPVWDDLGAFTVVSLPDRTPVAVTNTVFDPHLPVIDNTVRFVNGWGSVSFTLDDGVNFPAGDIELTVTWEGLTVSRTVSVESQPVFRDLSGNLVGNDLVWGPDENIRITGNTSVAGGSTLTIHPGTLVQVNTTGRLEAGTLITISGNLQALGTRDRPIHFFSERGADAMTLTQGGSASNPNAWRGFQLHGGGSSTMRHVYLTGAGNGSVVAHPRPPIIAMFGTHSLFADRGVFVDNDGMVFSGQGTGTYTIRKSLISRVGIGAEYFGNGHTLRISDSWFTSIGHAPEAANRDGDLLHIDGPRSDQLITGSIIADGGDDGIDHSGSSFRVQHSIIWDIRDKGISMTGGHADVHNTLIFGSATGIRGVATMNYMTIATPRPVVETDVARTSIVWPASIPTCTGIVEHSDVGNPDHLGCGVGNFSSDPQYADPGAYDYNPAPGSPALTAGPGQDRIGWLGFPYGSVCAGNGDCDDGNGCTFDLCENKLCTFTAIVGCSPCDIDEDCDDGNACTADSCGLDGACHRVPEDDGTACDDGRACTSPDVCGGGNCGGPVNCPGGQGCDADDICIPPVLGCQNDAGCDDGLFCNGAETCDVGSGDCVPGDAPDCDDAVACTIDSCDEAADACAHEPVDVRCDDGNLCTDDACDAVLGCQYGNNAADCDDGEPCTENDSCRDGACAGGPPPNCDDGVDCTEDFCEPGQGCAHGDLCPEGELCALERSRACEPEPTVITLRDGVNDYDGTTDTYVHAGQPDDNFGDSDTLIVDGEIPPEETRQILLRFDDLIGWEPGQVPPNARILSATLTLFITNPSDDGASLHRLLIPWNGDETWNSLVDGVQLDDVEAVDTPETTESSNGTDVPLELDVTASVNDWSAGADNTGWVLVTTGGGNDDWQFGASENGVEVRRPALTVVYLSCERGFVGDGVVCDDIDECGDPGSCADNANCVNSPGTFECICPEGFVGDGVDVCDDIDECAEDRCDPAAECTNLPGSFECRCPEGFEGDGFECVDINECNEVVCGANASCFNLPGSFRCECNGGFLGDGITCEDEDECAGDPDPCDPNARCSNLVGGFECECEDNFVGDGMVCVDVDECADDPCGANAVCINLPGAFECRCEPGFVGDGIACGECPGGVGNVCNRVGECEGTADAPVCVCGPGIVGDACEACAPGRGGYPSCFLCPDCDDGNPCTVDDCNLDGECFHEDRVGACDDGDPCTVADQCTDGVCGGGPACDDGNPCTEDVCNGGLCSREDVVGACDDGDACTSDDVCVDRECVGDAVDCDDGNPCTVGACDPDAGCAQEPVDGCCVGDGDCAPGDGCFADDGGCRAVQCDACEADADCGAGDNRCIDYASGSYCAVACDGAGAECPDDSECGELDDGTWVCQPLAGDCECMLEARTGCNEGDLVWFSSCGEVGDLAEDCAGRGCADDACCAEGTHEAGGQCVADGDGGPIPGDGGPDAGADTGVDADTIDGTVAGDMSTIDAQERDFGGSIERPDVGVDGGGSPADMGADADPTDPGKSDSCECNSGGGSSPVWMLLVLFGVARPRRRRR